MKNTFNDNYAASTPEFPVTNSIVPAWNMQQAQVVKDKIAAQRNYWNMLPVFQQYAAMNYPGLNCFAIFRGTVLIFDGKNYQCSDDDACYRTVHNIPCISTIAWYTPNLLPQFFKTFLQPIINMNIFHPLIPAITQFGKRILLDAIILSKHNLHSADNKFQALSTEKKYLQLANAISRFPLMFDEITTLRTINNQMPEHACDYLFKALHTVANGEIEKFLDLAAFTAKIMLGPNFLKTVLDIEPKLTIIKTNNKTFITHLLTAIFDIPKTEMSIRSTKHSSSIITKFNELAAISNGNYQFTSNLEPIRNTPLVYHTTLNNLSTNDGLKALIFAESCGIHFTLCNKFDSQIEDHKLLNSLVNGKTINFKTMLGEQTFYSQSSYAVIAYPNEENNTLTVADELCLSSNIPEEIGLFEKYECFTKEEIIWGQNILPLIGIYCLLNKSEKTEPEKPKLSQFQKFINLTCTSCSNNDQKLNGVGLKTIEKMFALYRKLLFNDTSDLKVTENYLKQNGYGYLTVKSEKNAGIRKICLSNGYSEDEVLTPNGGNHLYGLTIKPRNEVLSAIKNLKSQYDNQQKNKQLSTYQFNKKIIRLAKQTIRKLLNECEKYK